MTRTARYSKLLPIKDLQEADFAIIGVGAIGRQVALTLATMGVTQLTIYDPDTVEEANLGTQGYRPSQLGKKKVEATKLDCQFLNPDCEVFAVDTKFKESAFTYNFMCVDTIADRTSIWNLRFDDLQKWELFVDTRMAAESCRIITIDPGADPYYDYAKTLFEPSEAIEGECTARSTYYCASIAASLAVAQFTHRLRNHPIVPDIMLNLASMELMYEHEGDTVIASSMSPAPNLSI